MEFILKSKLSAEAHGKYCHKNVVYIKGAVDLEERETEQHNYLEQLIGSQHLSQAGW